MDKQGLWRGDSDIEISEINYKGYLKKQVQKWEWGSANIQLLNGDMIRIPTIPPLDQEFDLKPLFAVLP